MLPILVLLACLPQAPPSLVDAPAAHALLVGVGRYANLPPGLHLRGPENDVALMRRALVDVLAFPTENICTLATGEGVRDEDLPTRSHILEEIARVAALAESGQVSEFLLLLCGHGTQVPDLDGDETDGRDEVFLPCDVTQWNDAKGIVEGALTDDDLREALEAVRVTGTRVVLLVDSCHSGTLMRGAADDGVVWRELSAGDLGIPRSAWRSQRSGKERTAGMTGDTDGIVALYAAGSTERAPERSMANLLEAEPAYKEFGVFTHSFVRELCRSGGEETFAQILARMRARYDAEGLVSPRPTGEGDLSAVVRISGTAPAFQILRTEGELSVQNYGLIHDAVVGAEFDVYEPGRSGDPDASMGCVRVTRVELDRSLVESTGDRITWPSGLRGAPAVITTVPVSPVRLRLAYDGPEGSDIEAALEAVLAAHQDRFVRAESTDDSDWIVRDGDPAVIYRADRGIRAGHEVEPDRLAFTLASIFRVRNLFELTRHETCGGLPDRVEVRIVEEVGGVRRPIEQGQAGIPGTSVHIEARNRSGTTWYLTVHYIDTQYQIAKFELNSGGELAPTGEWVTINSEGQIFTDDTLGVGHVHVLALDRRQQLPDLDQPALRGPPRTRGSDQFSTFGAALSVLAYGKTRGVSASYDESGRAYAGLLEFDCDWPTLPHFAASEETAGPDRARPTTVARPRVSLVEYEALGTRRLLVTEDASRSHFFDLDGDAESTLNAADFDAELVLRQLDDRVCAFYDLDGKTAEAGERYELIRVDFDRDGVADVAHTLINGEWSVIDDPRVPLVQVDTFLKSMPNASGAWRNRALSTLRAFYLAEQ